MDTLIRRHFAARMTRALMVGAGVALVATGARADDKQTNSAIGIDPYYTGSLLSPSPAVPRAGLIAFEPYVIETINPGKYGVRGGVNPVSDVTSTTGTFTLIKYGITDHLTLGIFPETQINQDEMGFNSGSRIADFPVDLEYRFIDQDKKTGKPSVTFSAGAIVPAGRYENLPSAVDGQGVGTVRGRFGLIAQSLLYGESQHPVRIRVWGDAITPFGPTGLSNISAFGTDTGFRGQGYTGVSGFTGASVEYSFTQRFVLASDIQYTLGRSSDAVGFQGTKPVSLRSGHFDDLQLAPAFEYSFNDVFGIIMGVAFSVEGHNTSDFVQPQIAFNYVLDSTKPALGIPALFKNLPGFGN